MPDDVSDPGHIEGAPARLVWGPLATTDGAQPSWDRTQRTCSGTYCHGATLGGGTHTAPQWTKVDGSQAACGTCHGAPPPAPHPPDEDCHRCHGDTVTADGAIDVAGGRHIDGKVELTATACNTCHGSSQNPAPPKSVAGATSTDVLEVGAHQSCLNGGSRRSGIACGECHVVPGAVDAPGHIEGKPARVTFGPLATSGGLSPAWSPDTGRCSNTYCHGGTLTGGSNTAPIWNRVDGSQITCGSCHGTPPPPPHPALANCHACHPGTVGADGKLDVAGGRHMDGQVEQQESSVACTSCHGDATSPAPPVDTAGNSATTARGVGAHRSHLDPSTWHAPIACDECHVVPATVDAAGHIDHPLPATITFGTLASADGASPAYDTTSLACSSVYCHGATLTGTGANRAPTFTRVGVNEARCGTCHTIPPGGDHTTRVDCYTCHACVIDDAFQFLDGGRLHINGTVNLEPLGSCPTE